jgi:N-acyl-D-aspartate/D-glutamate deacylase
MSYSNGTKRPRYGSVDTTIVNGQVVFEKGKITVERGQGRFVRPNPSKPNSKSAAGRA